MTLEGIHGPGNKPYHLLKFDDPDSPSLCKTMADRDVGGYSTSDLTYQPADPTTSSPAHVLWHGNISTKLPKANPSIQRTGYAAFRNQDRGLSLLGRLFWNIDVYMFLALRVKSDGRRYFVNIQTDSIVVTDIHQHRLYTKRHRGARGPDDPGEWETVMIKWHEFVRTNHGTVVEPQSEMLREKVKSVGIGLIDRVEGPFELRVQGFWATNGGLEKKAAREERERDLEIAAKEPGAGISKGMGTAGKDKADESMHTSLRTATEDH